MASLSPGSRSLRSTRTAPRSRGGWSGNPADRECGLNGGQGGLAQDFGAHGRRDDDGLKKMAQEFQLSYLDQRQQGPGVGDDEGHGASISVRAGLGLGAEAGDFRFPLLRVEAEVGDAPARPQGQKVAPGE